MAPSMVNNHFKEWNSDALAVVIGTAISLFVALQLGLTIGFTFKVYGGLYFWSCVVAALGIIPYSIGFMMEYFKVSHLALAIALDCIGWSTMVTGQSFVLYSRLHLVYRNQKTTLRYIRYAIFTVGVVLHSTTSIVAFLANLRSGDEGTVARVYTVIEPTQMTIFTFQELALSILYIVSAVGKLKTTDEKESIRTLRQLAVTNVIIIMLDLALLIIEYSGNHVLQQTLKSVVYGVKLILELAILNKLQVLVHPCLRRNTFADTSHELGPMPARPVLRGSSDHLSTAPQWIANLDNSSQQPILDNLSEQPINLESNSIPLRSRTSVEKSDSTRQDIQTPTEDPDAILPVVPTDTLSSVGPKRTGRNRFSESNLIYADAMRTSSN